MPNRYTAPPTKDAADRLANAKKRRHEARKALKRARKNYKVMRVQVDRRKAKFNVYRKRFAAFHKDLDSMLTSTGAGEANQHVVLSLADWLKETVKRIPPVSVDDMNRIEQECDGDKLLADCELAADSTEGAVEAADHDVDVATDEMAVDVNVQTTLANAASVQAVAAYFEAHCAERVFEDVLRPWCSRAILAPPPSAKIGLIRVCGSCYRREERQLAFTTCDDCRINLCKQCSRYTITHACPSEKATRDILLASLNYVDSMLDGIIDTTTPCYKRFLTIRDGLENCYRFASGAGDEEPYPFERFRPIDDDDDDDSSNTDDDSSSSSPEVSRDYCEECGSSRVYCIMIDGPAMCGRCFFDKYVRHLEGDERLRDYQMEVVNDEYAYWED